MSPPFIARVACLAAALTVAGLPAADLAQAFSQIDQGDGRSSSKQGILSVPLPPLPPREGAGTAGPRDGSRPATDAPAATGGAAAKDRGPFAAPGDAREDAGGRENGRRPAPYLPAASQGPNDPPASGGDASAQTQIRYGEAELPAPVRDLRRRLIAIAQSGDIERLRSYIETDTTLSFGGDVGDPIAFLKSVSGDESGAEILAILMEILESGYVHADAGTEAEIFVWPYFTRVDIAALTPEQKVELFELITAGDYEAMKAFGAYNFYRAGITPDGQLQFFVAGD